MGIKLTDGLHGHAVFFFAPDGQPEPAIAAVHGCLRTEDEALGLERRSTISLPFLPVAAAVEEDIVSVRMERCSIRECRSANPR